MILSENVDSFGIPLAEKLVLKAWEEYASKVSDAYQARPMVESEYVSSWKALIAHVERMFEQMKSRIEVEFVDEDPYKSEAEVSADIRDNKRLKIYSGGTSHPIWTPEQNLKFRAYHDYLSHFSGGHQFGLKGEIAAYNQHMKMCPKEGQLALFTEIIGQASTAEKTGKFPPQKICKLHGFDYVNVGKMDEQEYEKNFLK